MGKKILCIILTLVLCITLMPAPVFADDAAKGAVESSTAVIAETYQEEEPALTDEMAVPEIEETTESVVPEEEATEAAVPEDEETTEAVIPEEEETTESAVPEKEKSMEEIIPEDEQVAKVLADEPQLEGISSVQALAEDVPEGTQYPCLLWKYAFGNSAGDTTYHSEPITQPPADVTYWEGYYWLSFYNFYFMDEDGRIQRAYSDELKYTCTDGSIEAEYNPYDNDWILYFDKVGSGTFTYTAYPRSASESAKTYTLKVICELPEVGLYKTAERTADSIKGFKCFINQQCTGYIIYKNVADAPASVDGLQLGKIGYDSSGQEPHIDTDNIISNAAFEKISTTVIKVTFTVADEYGYVIADSTGKGIVSFGAEEDTGPYLSVSTNGSLYKPAGWELVQLNNPDPKVFKDQKFRLYQSNGEFTDVTSQMVFTPSPDNVKSTVAVLDAKKGWTVTVQGTGIAKLTYNDGTSDYVQKYEGRMDTGNAAFYTCQNPTLISDRIWDTYGEICGLFATGKTTVYAMWDSTIHGDFAAEDVILKVAHNAGDYQNEFEFMDPESYKVTKLGAAHYKIEFVAEHLSIVQVTTSTRRDGHLASMRVYGTFIGVQMDQGERGWSSVKTIPQEPFRAGEGGGLKFWLITGNGEAGRKEITSDVTFSATSDKITWTQDASTGIYNLGLNDEGTATFRYKTNDYDLSAAFVCALSQVDCYSSQTASAATVLRNLKVEDKNTFYIVFKDPAEAEGLKDDCFGAWFYNANEPWNGKDLPAIFTKVSDTAYKVEVMNTPGGGELEIYYYDEDTDNGIEIAYITTVPTALSDCVVSLSNDSVSYTGNALKPAVTVKYPGGGTVPADSYKISYSNNTNVGKASVKVTANDGTGISGSTTVNFKILPKATTIKSPANAASGIKLTWGKVSKATGYKIYRSKGTGSYKLIKTISGGSIVTYTDKSDMTNGTKYRYKIVSVQKVGTVSYDSAYSSVKTIYYLTRPAISSAVNKSAGKITVKWKKNSKASGYNIKYVKGSKSKTVTAKSAATVSKVLTKLSKGSTYKIYVRSFKTVSKTKYYSGWSTVKKVKITK